LVLGILNAQAKNFTWTGGAHTTDWSTAQNWQDAQMLPGIPGAGDSASVSGVPVNLSQAVTVASLTATDGTTFSGQSLTVTASCSLTGVTFSTGSGTLTLQGATTITPGQFAVATVFQRNVTNAGTLTLKSGAQLSFSGAKTTLTNNGTFQVEDNTTILIGNAGNGSEVDNASMLTKAAGAGTANINLLVKNLANGTVNCSSGILKITSADQSAIFQAAQGAQITLTGEIDVHDHASFAGAGITSLKSVCYLDGIAKATGHLVVDTGSVDSSLGCYLYTKGDTTKTGTLEVSAGGIVDWMSGDITGTNSGGSLVIDSNGQFNISSNGFAVDNASVSNLGNTTWKGGTIVLAKANILNSGTFDIQSDDRMADVDMLSSFSNQGVFKKSVSPNDPNSQTPGLSEIQVKFTNSPLGSLQCNAGRLQLENGGRFFGGTIGAGMGAILNIESTNGSSYIVGDLPLDIVGVGRTSVTSTGTNATLIFPPDQSGAITVHGGTFELATGAVSGVGAITVFPGAAMAWSGGSFDDGNQGKNGSGNVFIKESATLQISGNSNRTFNGWNLNNSGAATVLPGTGDISFGPGSNVLNSGYFELQSDNSFLNTSAGVLSPTFFNLNKATLTKTAGTGQTNMFSLSNSGTVSIKKGTLLVSNYTDKSGTEPPGLINLDFANITFNQTATTYGTISGNGTITAKGGLVNDGVIEGDTIKIVGDLDTAGSTKLGDAPGVLTVQGNFIQRAAGAMYVPIRGTNASTPDFGQLKVSGTVTLAGSVFFTLENNFVPSSSDTFAFISAASISGQFAGVKGGQLNPSATGVTAKNVIGLPNNSLLNISTRLPVGTGSDVLIGGFIVQGPGTKLLLIRGIGPSLASAGIANALADPFLELHDATGATILSNDNWADTQQAEIAATGIPPKDSHDSAILATLYPGAYTAILRGVNSTTGIGLVEAYDLNAGEVQPVNISTRGRVQTGDNVMIGGFIIGGTQPMKVLVRAIGPSLVSAGITDALADPTLELHNPNGSLLFSNDNWQDTQKTDIQATGIPPSNTLESAILATLTPGGYTAIVAGKNSGTGVAVVEVYNLR
jgi:hypothetical protein